MDQAYEFVMLQVVNHHNHQFVQDYYHKAQSVYNDAFIHFDTSPEVCKAAASVGQRLMILAKHINELIIVDLLVAKDLAAEEEGVLRNNPNADLNLLGKIIQLRELADNQLENARANKIGLTIGSNSMRDWLIDLRG